MKEGLAFDHTLVNLQWRDRSGISPASSFTFESKLSLVVYGGAVKARRRARGRLTLGTAPLGNTSHSHFPRRDRGPAPLGLSFG